MPRPAALTIIQAIACRTADRIKALAARREL
jgi:hypothetical protein